MLRLNYWLRLAFLVFFGLGATLPLRNDCRPHTVAPDRIPRAAHETLAFVRRHGEAPAGQVGGRRFANYGSHGEWTGPFY